MNDILDNPIDVKSKAEDEGRYFAITIRRTKDPEEVSKKVYLDHLENLSVNKKFLLTEFKFENKGGLHLHGVIKFNPVRYSADKRPSYSLVSRDPMKYLRTRGYHTYVCPIHNMAGWQDYIQKEERHFPKLF